MSFLQARELVKRAKILPFPWKDVSKGFGFRSTRSKIIRESKEDLIEEDYSFALIVLSNIIFTIFCCFENDFQLIKKKETFALSTKYARVNIKILKNY